MVLPLDWSICCSGDTLCYSALGSAVHSWFNLKPSRSPGSVDIIMELNDYGIFCMECSMMVLADDPLPSHSALTISVLSVCFTDPLMLCDSEVS